MRDFASFVRFKKRDKNPWRSDTFSEVECLNCTDGIKSRKASLVMHVKKNMHLHPLSDNITKWSNTLKQFVGKLLIEFDHFVRLELKVLMLNLYSSQRNELQPRFKGSFHQLMFLEVQLER